MPILTVGTGVSIMVGTSEYADETTEYELTYEEPNAADPVAFLDGHSETPPTDAGSRAWTLTLTGARAEVAGSLYDYLWVNDGQPGDFTITDQGAEYVFTANIKPAPLTTVAGDANMFEVELTVVGQPVRTGAVASP